MRGEEGTEGERKEETCVGRKRRERNKRKREGRGEEKAFVY